MTIVQEFDALFLHSITDAISSSDAAYGVCINLMAENQTHNKINSLQEKNPIHSL